MQSVRSTTLDDQRLYDEIVRRRPDHEDPDKIILFGSRARGDRGLESDLDILVIRPSAKPRYARAGPLYGALARLPIEVDILVYTPDAVKEWSQVPQALVMTALREGIVLYQRPS